jgi:hypothetical protein
MEAMTEKKNPDREGLDRLADALVDDVMNASDEEVLAEFRETNGDPESNAVRMRELFQASVLLANKRRFAAAKAGAAANRTKPEISASPIDIGEARRRLRAVRDNPNVSPKLTLAARNEGELSDADILGMLDDLRELGALPSDEDSGGNS